MKSILKPPYESSKVSYKPSGIEWLGEIPQSWEIVKIKQVSKVVTGKTPCLENEWGNEMPFITPTDCFLDTKYTSLSQRKLSKIGIKNYNSIIIPQDSILVTCIASIGKVVMSNKEVITNQQINSVIPNTDLISPNFAFYVLLVTMPFAENYFCGYSILPILNKSEFSNIKIPLPPLQEQKAIAEFLDKKCDKISQFIESKQKLITLLQEKKQALINECVTKGVNCYTKHKARLSPISDEIPQGQKAAAFLRSGERGEALFAQKEKDSRQYKNSGVEYLGTIPKHWEVRKLKYICKINPQTNETLPNNFVYIDLESVAKGQLLKEQTINKEQAPSRAQRILQKQDILFQLVRPYQRNNYILNKNGDYVASTGYAQIRTKECVNFVYYALLENSFVERVILKSTGSNYPAITSNDFADLKIPLPPLQEQKAIAEFLDTQITKIDLTIEKTKEQITLIKEYKTSLINQAVCGRIQLKD